MAPVEMGIDEIQPRRGSPMSEQPWLDVFGPQRFAQEGVVEQVYLTYRQIIGGPPVPVEQLQVAGLCIDIVCILGWHAEISGIAMGNKVERQTIRAQ